MYDVIPVSYQLALGLNLTSMVPRLMDLYFLWVSWLFHLIAPRHSLVDCTLRVFQPFEREREREQLVSEQIHSNVER